MRFWFVLVLLMVLLSGCSGYEITDEISSGDKTVTKRSVARGLVHRPEMPHHEASVIEDDSVGAGGTAGRQGPQDPQGMWFLYPLGGIAMVAGIAGAFFFKRYWTGGMAALGGLLLILVAFLLHSYPWVTLLIPVAACAGGAWFLVSSNKGQKLRSYFERASRALKQTVAGFEQVKQGQDSSTRKAMNQAMASTQDADVQRLVQEQKMLLR